MEKTKEDNVFSQILHTTVREEVPILAHQKSIEQRLQDEKLDRKARKALANEKRQKLEKGHILPSDLTLNKEKHLRKIATKGVVQLFNAIKQQQKSTDEKSKEKDTKLTKQNFLEMIKS
ncbi:Rrp15p-domain-containing protein [Rozella allomycis CSF55]|uniref:Rrp15p-domain-containing protein n=1 Tax=Rozella allomycis (strain CSF55) TaxID=988480 RepID=A0A075AWG5_ROZAC|nr:Protein of unknown function DUF1665 domain-containing protein [Rozella allomycis CSF55]RKP19106.1 Rrp15p-domain-containing protein [Rozella allomycis CSF55]|eukprot:EPZ33052.1 Protein of unknown function DUF1665 domain-containing protein [Rozella allomycis CSF55]